ncbi:MAG: J domain-containing protein [Alphaproteobacteria bacterium]|nr:J domain-containing protein [Alphaproteobacteria bacterium]
MPGCRAHGEYKAPKDRNLNRHYHFCLDHVREYNKAWNFFEGMSAGEVEDHMLKSIYGDRPTWKYGVNGNAEEALYNRAWQTWHGTDEPPPRQDQKRFKSTSSLSQNTPEYEAMAIMGLEPPLSLPAIKTRYKELAKKHHPDLNKGCPKSEELLKQINMAYTILKLAYEKFADLPERN